MRGFDRTCVRTTACDLHKKASVFYFLVLIGGVKMSDRVVKEMVGF